MSTRSTRRSSVAVDVQTPYPQHRRKRSRADVPDSPDSPHTPTLPNPLLSSASSGEKKRRRKVKFSQVDVQEFTRQQARDKVPSDGGAALGLGKAVGQPLQRRVSAFEKERADSGRSPAKVYRTRKLSFSSRERILIDDDADVRSPLQKRQSIMEFSKELKTIRNSRSRNIGCKCKAGDKCKKNCFCVRQSLPCLYDICGCECRGEKCREKHNHCVNPRKEGDLDENSIAESE